MLHTLLREHKLKLVNAKARLSHIENCKFVFYSDKNVTKMAENVKFTKYFMRYCAVANCNYAISVVLQIKLNNPAWPSSLLTYASPKGIFIAIECRVSYIL